MKKSFLISLLVAMQLVALGFGNFNVDLDSGAGNSTSITNPVTANNGENIAIIGGNTNNKRVDQTGKINKIFPDVLSAGKSITFYTDSKIKKSSNDLTTLELFENNTKTKCDGKNCIATKTAPLFLNSFDFSCKRDNGIELVKNTTLSDKNISNLTINGENLEITFVAPKNSFGERVQHIGVITDNNEKSTYIFKKGDYYIEALNIESIAKVDNNLKASLFNASSIAIAKVFDANLNIKVEGRVRIFLNKDSHITKKSDKYAEMNSISINSSMKNESNNLIIYSKGKLDIEASGNYQMKAIVYGYDNISLQGDKFSKFTGVVHSDKEIHIGIQNIFNKKQGSSGTFTYDTKALNNLYLFSDILIEKLPKDPGKEGKKTLLGIDSNGNGVRDDVEIWVLNRFDNPETILIDTAMEKVKNFQKIIATPKGSDVKIYQDIRYFKSCITTSLHYYCEKHNLSMAWELRRFFAELKDTIFNTRDRFSYFIEYQKRFKINLERANKFKNCIEYYNNYGGNK